MGFADDGVEEPEVDDLWFLLLVACCLRLKEIPVERL
jgi:hypothetical protein